ncbi:MAG: sigma-54-dependent Fis family transcriptional regulator [Rickettsiales bacterium]|jgi:DNA-binding NtrC family response regulator|nr:sigma-54-dependent Fis family transcriptional regulator [Rickettsiales bacterium]
MRLLIIGDLRGQIGAATSIAQKRGAKVVQAPTIEAALNLLRSGKGADVIMIDVTQDVGALVSGLEAEHIHIPVIGCGLNDNPQDAVRAIKAGAREYLPLPPDEELISSILEAITDDSVEMVVQSPSMRKMIELADKVAPSEASILITGESGTGKEVMARYIHKKSKRAQKDLIGVNCAAIPENLLESELFGHEKGAFTGAVARRIGKFEEANQGILLLDEISEMDVRLQAKLLRAIQEKEIDRVGGSKPVKLDIRIIATSNRDLQQEVKAGRFREDLFFRLNIINLQLPPLRERKEDIESFAKHFIRKYSEINDVPVRPLSKEAFFALQEYPWPGNVRELENTIHRAVLLASGDSIGTEAILLEGSYTAQENAVAATGTSGNMGGLVGRTMESVEQDLIIQTLEHCFGNRTKAATILGISIRTLRNKLKAYEEENTH